MGFGRSECQPENPNGGQNCSVTNQKVALFAYNYFLGTCVIARQDGLDYDCAPDGSFEPLQCQTEGDNLRCVCVQPSNGSPIMNTLVIIDDIEDAPNCEQFGEYNDKIMNCQ